MKILHLETGSSLYGGGLQVAYLIKWLQSNGVDCVLLADKRSELIDKSRNEGAEVHGLNIAGELDLRIFFKMLFLIWKQKPDVVHVHSRRGADLWGPLAAVLMGVGLVVTRRVDNAENAIVSRIRYSIAQVIVGISREICSVVCEAGIPSSKVIKILSGVDADQFRPTKNQSLSKLLKLPEDAVTVGMVAQFIPRKGHNRMLKIAEILLDEYPNLHFILFGKGPLWDSVKAAAESQKHASRIHLPGFRTDLPDLMPDLDILLHPAEMEGLGVSLLQAGACSIPIVAGNAGGIPEIIENGKTGYLVSPLEVSDYVEKLRYLIENEDFRISMGRAALERIHEIFSFQSMAKQNYFLYEKLYRVI